MIERLRRTLADAFFIVLAAIAMGTFVSAANFTDYGPLVALDVGTVIIGVSLVAGVALGLRIPEEEPQAVVLHAFASGLGAIAIVMVTIFAPILAGVIPSLEVLGSSGSARLAFLFTALFIVPIHVVGSVIGYALSDLLAPSRFGGGRDTAGR